MPRRSPALTFGLDQTLISSLHQQIAYRAKGAPATEPTRGQGLGVQAQTQQRGAIPPGASGPVRAHRPMGTEARSLDALQELLGPECVPQKLTHEICNLATLQATHC